MNHADFQKIGRTLADYVKSDGKSSILKSVVQVGAGMAAGYAYDMTGYVTSFFSSSEPVGVSIPAEIKVFLQQNEILDPSGLMAYALETKQTNWVDTVQESLAKQDELLKRVMDENHEEYTDRNKRILKNMQKMQDRKELSDLFGVVEGFVEKHVQNKGIGAVKLENFKKRWMKGKLKFKDFIRLGEQLQISPQDVANLYKALVDGFNYYKNQPVIGGYLMPYQGYVKAAEILVPAMGHDEFNKFVVSLGELVDAEEMSLQQAISLITELPASVTSADLAAVMENDSVRVLMSSYSSTVNVGFYGFIEAATRVGEGNLAKGIDRIRQISPEEIKIIGQIESIIGQQTPVEQEVGSDSGMESDVEENTVLDHGDQKLENILTLLDEVKKLPQERVELFKRLGLPMDMLLNNVEMFSHLGQVHGDRIKVLFNKIQSGISDPLNLTIDLLDEVRQIDANEKEFLKEMANRFLGEEGCQYLSDVFLFADALDKDNIGADNLRGLVANIKAGASDAGGVLTKHASSLPLIAWNMFNKDFAVQWAKNAALLMAIVAATVAVIVPGAAIAAWVLIGLSVFTVAAVFVVRLAKLNKVNTARVEMQDLLGKCDSKTKALQFLKACVAPDKIHSGDSQDMVKAAEILKQEGAGFAMYLPIIQGADEEIANPTNDKSDMKPGQ